MLKKTPKPAETVCHNRLVIPNEKLRDTHIGFDGGNITSDSGVMLLAKTDRKFDVCRRIAECFTDLRQQNLIEHDLISLIRQRIYAIPLGYEDLNDHDHISKDIALAAAVGVAEPDGRARVKEQDRDRPLAGKSTLNRLELSAPNSTSSCTEKKISANTDKLEKLFVELFLDNSGDEPEMIFLDFDNTDDPIHGDQEGRYFNGYYDSYCYLPLYVFCGKHLLYANLNLSSEDGATGSVEFLEWAVPKIRERWPNTKIVFRGDSGFQRERIMHWCETNGLYYVIGLSRNNTLKGMSEVALMLAQFAWSVTGKTGRAFSDFMYKTKESWSRERRVICRMEYHGSKPEGRESNPRYIVTNLPSSEHDMQQTYEKLYCARGDMENRIKEQQLCLFADRTSTSNMASNQLRLWFASFAYVLMNLLRQFGLAGTDMANARCDTIRLCLFKIGALVTVSVRRVRLQMPTTYPHQKIFMIAMKRLL